MTVKAQLGSDTIASVSSASSLAVHIGSPVLALCRKLIEAGYPSSADLEAYRGETLALRVRSIGEAAGLEINGAGTGFRTAPKPGSAPLVSQLELAATSLSSTA